jgi:dienelactone hydrolase
MKKGMRIRLWIILATAVWIGCNGTGALDENEHYQEGNTASVDWNSQPSDSEYAQALAKIPSNITTKRIQLSRQLSEDEYSEDSTKAAIHSYWYWSWKSFSWELADRKYAVTFFYDRNAFDEASAAGNTLPIVIFTSGAGIKVVDYKEMLSRIANRGYMVAAIEHTYIDPMVKIDGLWRLGLKNIIKILNSSTEHLEEFEHVNEGNDSEVPIYPDYIPQFVYDVLEYEAQDVKSFIDFIESEIQSDCINDCSGLLGEIEKVVSMDKIAYAGHSLGGMTATLTACNGLDNNTQNPYFDERIKAVISFDGFAYNHGIFTKTPYKLQSPYLMLAADATWPGGDLEPPKMIGLMTEDSVKSIGGFEDQSHSFVVEILGSNHGSFMTQMFIIPPDLHVVDVAAKYVDLFLREVFADEENLTLELFYNDECNSEDAIVSLKYSSQLPSWWFDEMSFCAPGVDFPIPGNATDSEEYGVVESRVLDLFDRLVDEVPHPSLENGQSENLQQVKEQIIQVMQGMGYAPQKEAGVGGTNFFNCLLPESMQNDTEYSGGVNIILDITGTDPSLSPLYLTAHYDTVSTTPGANDPMSGVIAILELLKRLSPEVDLSTQSFKGFERTLRVRIWDQEEVGLIGSAFYINNRPELNRDNVYGLINLETIGNFSSEPDSQPIPEAMGFLFPEKAKAHEARYKNRADFIIVIGDPGSKHLIDAMKSVIPQRERMVDLLITDEPKLYWIPIGTAGLAIPLKFENPFYNIFFDLTDIIFKWNSTHDEDEWINLPTTDIFRSDHTPFWMRGLTRHQRGIPALFVTDSANLRHDDYHTPNDTLENISVGHYLSLITRVEQALRKLLVND